MTQRQQKRFEKNLVIQKDDRWYNISVDPIINIHGAFAGAVHMMEDITDIKQAEGELKRSLDEREILFTELKHRVKNNLQLL